MIIPNLQITQSPKCFNFIVLIFLCGSSHQRVMILYIMWQYNCYEKWLFIYVPFWISHLVHFSFQVMKLSCNYFSLLKINNHQNHQWRIIHINLPSTIVKPNDIAPDFLWLINTCTLFSWVCKSHFLPLPPKPHPFLTTKMNKGNTVTRKLHSCWPPSPTINKYIPTNNSVNCARYQSW